MEFTFKPEKKRCQSIPFLQRFKTKINKVDRQSGILGALGIRIGRNNLSEARKRCKTEAIQIKVRSDPRHLRTITHNQSDFDLINNVTVNGFPTLGQQEFFNKENISRNQNASDVNRKVNHAKKSRVCFDFEKEQLLSHSRDMKDSLLPKIREKIGANTSEVQSRVKAKAMFFDKNRKKAPVLLLPKRQDRGVMLR